MTTRPQVDEAALRKLAEAARAQETNLGVRSPLHHEAVRRHMEFHHEATPTTVLALLDLVAALRSKVAALTGERDRLRDEHHVDEITGHCARCCCDECCTAEVIRKDAAVANAEDEFAPDGAEGEGP